MIKLINNYKGVIIFVLALIVSVNLIDCRVKQIDSMEQNKQVAYYEK